MMTPSATSSTGVPGSRQKNCNTCVQAKRRCDRRMPVCSRCIKKKIACTYSKPRLANRPGEHAKAPPAPCTEALSLESSLHFPFDIPELSFDTNGLETIPNSFPPDFVVDSTPHAVQGTTSSSGTSIDPFMRFIDDNISPSSDQWLVGTEEDHLLQRSTTPPGGADVARSFQSMAACHLDAWHIYDPKTPLHFVLNQVKRFPGDMATKNTTPFIHRFLYHNYTPQCIVSCFTTCVLYESRTPANAAMTMKALSNSARELVDAEVSRVMPTPIEKLARCQALFIYQIIRLFDGDITLRAQGERDMGTLEAWLDELRHIRDNLGTLARLEYTAIKEQSPTEWGKWIFSECVRRTILIAYAAMGLYKILKDPAFDDPGNHWAYAHRWTLGRSLWEASSPAAFQRSWKESRHFIITSFALDDFVENGKSEEVDEYAELYLNVYMGVDAARDFMRRDETT